MGVSTSSGFWLPAKGMSSRWSSTEALMNGVGDVDWEIMLDPGILPIIVHLKPR